MSIPAVERPPHIDPSRSRRTIWASNRRRLIAYGRWQPTEFVDPSPVREHIANLRRFGLSVATIAGLASEDRGTAGEIIYPNHSSYLRVISAERAAKYLAHQEWFDIIAAETGRLNDEIERLQTERVIAWQSSAQRQERTVGVGATCGAEVELEVERDLATLADPRPCRGVNVNVCNAEGCFGEACRKGDA